MQTTQSVVNDSLDFPPLFLSLNLNLVKNLVYVGNNGQKNPGNNNEMKIYFYVYFFEFLRLFKRRPNRESYANELTINHRDWNGTGDCFEPPL